MEAHAALVGAEAVVELHAPRAVGPHVAVIVLPDDAENDDPVRFGHALENGRFAILGVFTDEGHEGRGDLKNGLMEFGLMGIATNQTLHEGLEVLVVARMGAQIFGHQFLPRIGPKRLAVI